jgi:hypothetical protein
MVDCPLITYFYFSFCLLHLFGLCTPALLASRVESSSTRAHSCWLETSEKRA